MVMIPWDFQLDLAKRASLLLSKYKLAYLAMEERTGKSITGLLAIEQFTDIKRVLIITKKKAIEGWRETLAECEGLTKTYMVINYNSLHKVKFVADIVILDEAHKYVSSYPKKSATWTMTKAHCLNKPLIYMSATPYAQGLQLLYHQLALSSYSPWNKYQNFYTWYRDYALRDANGNTETIWINGRAIETYKRVDYNKTMPSVQHLFIVKKRTELGFTQEPEDIIHNIVLSDKTKQAYNTLLKNKVLEFSITGNDRYTLIADTILKLRTALHMLEGGVLKIDSEYLILNIADKVDYILSTWGDTNDMVIMYQYIAEGNKLRKTFTKALILQSTSYAEGIDLSHKKHLIVYSQNFSTADYIQRRARQANKNRDTAIKVHFLIVKNAISAQVYKSVSVNKINYTDKLFEALTI